MISSRLLVALLASAVLSAACRTTAPTPSASPAAPAAAPQADLLDVPKPKDWRHVGLGGPGCPDGKEKQSVAALLAAYPAAKHKGEPLVALAICRYLSGDAAGAKADLKAAQALPADDNGDTLLQATLFLVEATANDTKAALGLDRGRKQALVDAGTLEESGAKTEGGALRAELKGKKLYDEAELAGLRARQDALRDFVRFLIDARPAYKPAKDSERYLDETFGRRDAGKP